MTNCSKTAALGKIKSGAPRVLRWWPPSRAAFNDGKIAYLCESVCNSFNVELESERQAAPIAPSSEIVQVIFFAEFLTTNPLSRSHEFNVYAV